jgi:undecaprenyl-diphosphatase
MDKIIEAIILGIIQGITEFFPISSSAHLEVVPWIFNWTKISPSFDLALHFGTLIALIVYFFKDGLSLIKSGFAVVIINIGKKFSKSSKTRFKVSDESKVKEGNLFWYIIFATIPAGILSILLDKLSEKIINDNQVVRIALIAVASIIMGALLYFVDKKSKTKKNFEELTLKNTMLIGLSQAFAAAFPGVSRSGATITTARSLGYDRESSAKVSFFLSVPLILAACLVKIPDFDLTYPVPFFLGIFVSFVVGLIVINTLFNYLKSGDYKLFAVYRVVFGTLLVITLIIEGLMG